MKKLHSVIAILVLLAMILSACGQTTGGHIDGKPESVSAGSENEMQADKFFTDEYSNAEATTIYISPENKMETYDSRIYLDPENRNETELVRYNINEINYDGNDIVIYYDYYFYEHDNEEILVYLDGILQDVDIEQDGVYLGKATECDIDFAPEVQSTVKMTFRPNTGKKGDILDLGIVAIRYPKYTKVGPVYRLKDKLVDINSDLFGYSWLARISDPIKLIMQEDADTQTTVNASYSGLKITDIDPYIAKYHDETEEGQPLADFLDWRTDNLHGLICNEPEDILIKKFGSHLINDRFEAKRSEETQFNIYLYGTPGTYRIGLYANGVIQPVFDGMNHAEVTLEYDKQATFTVTIDTTDFDDYTSLRLVIYNADGEDEYFRYKYPSENKDASTMILK